MAQKRKHEDIPIAFPLSDGLQVDEDTERKAKVARLESHAESLRLALREEGVVAYRRNKEIEELRAKNAEQRDELKANIEVVRKMKIDMRFINLSRKWLVSEKEVLQARLDELSRKLEGVCANPHVQKLQAENKMLRAELSRHEAHARTQKRMARLQKQLG